MEWLAAEYGIPFSEAVWSLPVVLSIAMMPVRNERRGGSGGPNYVARASMSARNAARRFLETNFEIVPAPVAETGWLLG